MSKWNLGWLVGIVGVAALGLSITYSAPTREGIQAKHENLKLVLDVSQLVDEKYVKPLDAKQKREYWENSINGALQALDPYSAFLGEEECKEFNKQSEGKFGGVGIRLAADSKQIYVESPMVGTPAYEAGILAGDIILKIDGKSTQTMSMTKAVDLITGDEGTDVTLTVLHEGAKELKEAVDIKITRAKINIESVLGDQRMKDNLKEWDFWIDHKEKIAYIRIAGFTKTTVDELTKVVELLQRAPGMRGLIVDLRGNPGGLLDAAVDVSSIFLPEEGKPIVTTKGREKGQETTFTSKHTHPNLKTTNDYPLVILINRGSASASEIVAAALQDYRRAIIIGERSFGKGSVQNVIPMENKTTALKLTTASYWRPSGKNVHRFPDSKESDDWGVKPNPGFEVKLPQEERIDYLKYRRDRDVVRRGPAPEKKDDAKKDGAKAKEPFHDRVLEKALDYIHGELNKAGKRDAAAPIPAPAQRASAMAPRWLPRFNVARAEVPQGLRFQAAMAQQGIGRGT